MPKKGKTKKTTVKVTKTKKGLAQTFVDTIASRKKKQAAMLKELGF